MMAVLITALAVICCLVLALLLYAIGALLADLRRALEALRSRLVKPADSTNQLPSRQLSADGIATHQLSADRIVKAHIEKLPLVRGDIALGTTADVERTFATCSAPDILSMWGVVEVLGYRLHVHKIERIEGKE